MKEEYEFQYKSLYMASQGVVFAQELKLYVNSEAWILNTSYWTRITQQKNYLNWYLGQRLFLRYS